MHTKATPPLHRLHAAGQIPSRAGHGVDDGAWDVAPGARWLVWWYFCRRQPFKLLIILAFQTADQFAIGGISAVDAEALYTTRCLDDGDIRDFDYAPTYVGISVEL